MNELLIDLHSNADTALYEQIYEYIKQSIMDGRLSQGERLPSARMLAQQLQISRSTVDAAYGQLVSEGYLEAKRGSGYYVCDIGALYDVSPGRDGSREKGSGLERAGVLQSGWKKQDELRESAEMDVERNRIFSADGQNRNGKDSQIKYNFLPGQIDSRGFSYGTWRKAGKEAMLEIEHELLLPGHPQGEYGLRRAIAGYLYQARGVRCVPEQLVVGAGNEYLLLLLGQILGTDRKAAMENPTYLQAYYTFKNMGYEVKAVPMDQDGILAEEIPQKEVSLVYVMPSHQFPLGCVMPLKRRLQLLAWADTGADRYIIEDDHDSEFRYKGKPVPSLQSMAGEEKIIYLGTFSNSIMPSIRVSYMVLPWELLYRYQKTCGFYASTVSRLQQMTVCRFIENGSFGRHLNKMRRIYKGKHDRLLQLLKGRTWVDKIYGAHAGLHIAVELNCRYTEEEIISRAAGRGLLIQGISGCYIEGSKKTDCNPVLLLGFGNLSDEMINEGVGVLEQCVCGSYNIICNGSSVG